MLLFLVLLALSIVSMLLWWRTRSGYRHRLDILALVSGGAAIMFFVDSLHSYVEGRELLELSPGTATQSAVLALSTVAVWSVFLARYRLKHKL